MEPAAVLRVLVSVEGISRANRKLMAFQGELDKAARNTEDATAKVSKFGLTKGVATLGADATDANQKITDVTAKLDGLDKATVRPLAELQAAGVRIEINRVTAQLQDMSKQKATPEVTVQTARAAAKLESLQGQVSKLDGRRVAVDADTGGLDRFSRSLHRADVEGNVLARTIALVKPAALISGAGLAAQAVSALAGAAVAAGAALAPLAGAAAAYPAIFAAVKQGALVAKLALGDVAKVTEQFTKALARPTPAINGLKDRLKEFVPEIVHLRNIAQGPVLRGLTDGVGSASANLGRLNPIVRGTAIALGDLARRAGELVGSKGFGQDLSTIGARNTKIITILGGAALDVANALRNVIVAAGPLTMWLTRLAAGWAQSASDAAKAGRESGTLAAFFDKTRVAISYVVSIAGSLGKAFLNIGKAAFPVGEQILGALDKAAEGFSRWTGTVKGQTALKDYFERAKAPIFEVGKLIRDVTKGFFSLGAQPGLAKMIAQVRTELLPVLLRVVNSTTAAFGPAFINMITAFAKAFEPLAGSSGPLILYVKILTNLANAATWITTNVPGAAQAITFLVGAMAVSKAVGFAGSITGATTAIGLLSTAATAGIGVQVRFAATFAAVKAGMLAGAAATGVMTAAQWALDVAMTANPIGLVVVGLAALGAAFYLAYTKVELFRTGVDATFNFIKSNWPLLLAILTGPIGLAVYAIVKNWATVQAATTAVWTAISGFLRTVWGAILTAARAVWTAIGTAILAPIRFARDLLPEVLAGIANRMAAAWTFIRAALGVAWGAIRDGILAPVRLARDLIPEVLAGIGNRMGAAWTAIRTAVGVAWGAVSGAILGAIRGARDAIPEIVSGMGNRLATGFSTILGAVKGFAGNVKDGISDAFKGAANAVIGFVNAIIGAINLIPGVKNIDKISKLAEGGVFKGGPNGNGKAAARGLAHGGAFARTGGIVKQPITLMGEEAPCIARGTLIETSTGPRPIERVEVGEQVLTRNGYRPVVWSGITRRDAEVLRVTSVDGHNVLCTPDHRIWSMSGGRDGNGSRDRVGSGDLRGRGLLSDHDNQGQESVLDVGLADDGPRHGAAVSGHRRIGEHPSLLATGGIQDDLRHGCSEARGRGAHDHRLSALARPTAQGQGAGAACAHREVESDGEASGGVLSTRSSALAGEHLRESEGLRDLLDVQAGSGARMEQAQVRDQSCARAEGARHRSGGCTTQARRPRMERAAEEAAPRIVAPEACWREARELALGDWVWTLAESGGLVPTRIASIAPEERIDTYDLCVETDHEFIAGGILVHNSHPEYVIPTNPAYRGRAQALLMQAANAIGMAKGGIYSVGDMTKLAAAAGADSPGVMGAIGMAESSGNPRANGPPDGRGLWQVEWPVWRGTMAKRGLTDAYDPSQNAQMMKIIQAQQGLQAWVVYQTGAYKKFLGGGGGGGLFDKIGGAISGAAGAVGGVLGDLLSKGAGFILDKLPGVGDLPEWLQGMGTNVLAQATGWIKDKVSDLVSANKSSGGGSPGPAGGPKGVSTYKGVQLADWVIGALKHAQSKGVNVQPTSGYRPGVDPNTASGKSLHQGIQYPNGAVDFGGYTSGLAMKMAVVNATKDYKYPLLAPKGFRDDGHASGTGHYMGGVYGGALGSYAAGTDYVPQTGPYVLHKGESVTPAGENGSSELAAEIRALRETLQAEGTVDVLEALSQIVSTKQGRRYGLRAQTAGSGSVALP